MKTVLVKKDIEVTEIAESDIGLWEKQGWKLVPDPKAAKPADPAPQSATLNSQIPPPAASASGSVNGAPTGANASPNKPRKHN
jgi:hypothetical protein